MTQGNDWPLEFFGVRAERLAKEPPHEVLLLMDLLIRIICTRMFAPFNRTRLVPEAQKVKEGENIIRKPRPQKQLSRPRYITRIEGGNDKIGDTLVFSQKEWGVEIFGG